MLANLYRRYRHQLLPKIEDNKLAEIFHAVFKKIVFRRFEGFDRVEGKEMKIRDEDWDNLIILDACRHDLFEEVVGECDFRYSQGSNSAEFIKKNFSEGDWSDALYVTANPHFHESQFKHITGRDPGEVFHTVFHTYEDKWSKEKSTVMPSDVISDLKTAKKLFPDKKIIAHFMQPHFPFVNSEISSTGFNPEYEDEELGVWAKAQLGKLEREELWNAYADNLKFVWEEIEEEINDLDGKTIVTADHGNFVGENGFYGHPYKVHAEVLLKVPWKEI